MEKKKFYINSKALKESKSHSENLKDYITSKSDLESEKEIEIKYNENITEQQMEIILSSKKFCDYIQKLDYNSLIVRGIKVLSVYMFGKNVGFLSIDVDCSLKTHPEKKLPGYVFIRGKSVGIFVVINNKYMVLTRQFRVPVGRFMCEIPAGMLDESGDFSGVAAKELEEEIGVKINQKDLVYLTSMYPSSGGSDEEIIFYYLNLNLEEKEIEDMRSKTFGEENSDEVITLKITDINYENILETKDSKLITAAFAAENKLGLVIPRK